MRKFAVQIALLVIIGGAIYIGLFKRDWFVGKVKDVAREAKGYTAAQTPQEAIDKFRDAVKSRDYESAATYCGPEYAEQMRKGAKAAKELGDGIDDLLAAMDKHGVTQTDKTKFMVRLLEPFPTSIKTLSIKKQGEDKAYAVLVREDDAPLTKEIVQETWNINPLMFSSLAKDLPKEVELRREGEGDKIAWKIYFPVSANQRLAVDKLNDKYKDFVKALVVVDREVKNDSTTKSNVEQRLKSELEDANKS